MQVSEMDSLCETIVSAKARIAALEEQIEAEKEGIREIQRRVKEYFIETGRQDPYRSPHGTLFLREDLSVLQPKGEKLKIVYDHLVKIYGAEAAWERMSIHNATLKAEIKDHFKAVEERGGDPILEPFPGIQPPKTVQTLQFKRKI